MSEFNDIDLDAQRIIVSLLDPFSRLTLSLASKILHSNFRPNSKLNPNDYILTSIRMGMFKMTEFLLSLGASLEDAHLNFALDCPLPARRRFADLFLTYFDSNKIDEFEKDIWEESLIKLSVSVGDLSLITLLWEKFPDKNSQFCAFISRAFQSPNPIDVIEFIREKVKGNDKEFETGVISGAISADNLELWKKYCDSGFSSEADLDRYISLMEPRKSKGTKIIKYLWNKIPEIKSSRTIGQKMFSSVVDVGNIEAIKFLFERLKLNGNYLNIHKLSFFNKFDESEVHEAITVLEALGYSFHRGCDDIEAYTEAIFPGVEFEPPMFSHRKVKPPSIVRASQVANALDKYISPKTYANISEDSLHKYFLYSSMTNDLAFLDFLETKGAFSWTNQIQIFLEALVKTAAAEVIHESVFPDLIRDLNRRDPSWFQMNVVVPNEGFGIFNSSFGEHRMLVHLMNVSNYYPLANYAMVTTIKLDRALWNEMWAEAGVSGHDTFTLGIFVRASFQRAHRKDFKKISRMLRLIFITYGPENVNVEDVRNRACAEIRKERDSELIMQAIAAAFK